MSQPTQSDLHPVDPILTNYALGYEQAESRFVMTRASVPVGVNEMSGTYFVFDKKYWFSDEMKQRAPGAPYAEGAFGVSTDTYATEQWALGAAVPDEDEAANQAPLSQEQAKTRWLSGRALIRKDRLFSALMATGVWTTDGTISAKWSTTSTPVTDIRTGKRTISQLTGFTPNLAVMGEIVEDRLLTNADIVDRLKYSQAATVDGVRQALAAVLGISRLVVAEAIYNSANEALTAVMTPIVDDDILLCYQDPAAGIFEPTAFKAFYWAPGGGLGGVRKYYSEERDATMLKYKMQLTIKKVAADLGYFIADCVD